MPSRTPARDVAHPAFYSPSGLFAATYKLLDEPTFAMLRSRLCARRVLDRLQHRSAHRLEASIGEAVQQLDAHIRRKRRKHETLASAAETTYTPVEPSPLLNDPAVRRELLRTEGGTR